MGKIASALIGVCVGDALGVPVEFQDRSERLLHPVTTMIGDGTHEQPPGTWSDDSSLTLCLADVLCHHGYDLDAIAQSFCRWYQAGFWTARGEIFDPFRGRYFRLKQRKRNLNQSKKKSRNDQ